MNKPRKALKDAGISVADGPSVAYFDAGPFGRFEYNSAVFKTIDEMVAAAVLMINQAADTCPDPVILLRREFYAAPDPINDGLLISARWVVVPNVVSAYAAVVVPAEAQLWKDHEAWQKSKQECARDA